jgi:hypothetical protein
MNEGYGVGFHAAVIGNRSLEIAEFFPRRGTPGFARDCPPQPPAEGFVDDRLTEDDLRVRLLAPFHAGVYANDTYPAGEG